MVQQSDVSPEVIEFLLLDERLHPKEFTVKKWAELRNDPSFNELAHGALVFIAEHYQGISDESILRTEGFITGIAFAVTAIKQSREAIKQDSQFLTPEEA